MVETLEKELKKLGFKKKWLIDKSGYWFSMLINHNDLKLEIYSEPDRGILLLQIKAGDYCSNKITMNKYYDAIAKYPCNLKSIKKLIKQYK